MLQSLSIVGIVKRGESRNVAKIIVTGGAGFVGSNLVDALVERGDEIIVIDNFSTGKRENLDKSRDKILTIELSLDLNNAWENFDNLKGADAIVHLAALPRVGRSIDNPVETHIANVNGTLSVLELARLLKIKRFIYASSSSVYGDVDPENFPIKETYLDLNPENPYATQKLIGEQYCKVYQKVYGLNTVMLRFFNVYGSRMATEGAYKLIFAWWIEQIKAGKRLSIYGDGTQTRDFTHVTDIVTGIIASIDKPLDSVITMPINLCTGIETSVNELAELFNWGTEKVTNPRGKDEKRKVGSNERAKSILNWEPQVTLTNGIEKLRSEHGI